MSTVIKHKQFASHKVYETTVAGRPLSIEVGKVAELANASALVKYGETTVMVAVTASARPRDGIDFFPLSVDFEEKLYSVGRIRPAQRRGGHLHRHERGLRLLPRGHRHDRRVRLPELLRHPLGRAHRLHGGGVQ